MARTKVIEGSVEVRSIIDGAGLSGFDARVMVRRSSGRVIRESCADRHPRRHRDRRRAQECGYQALARLILQR